LVDFASTHLWIPGYLTLPDTDMRTPAGIVQVDRETEATWHTDTEQIALIKCIIHFHINPVSLD